MARRRCVGCGALAAQATLERYVAEGGVPVPDPERIRSGRGAYLHPGAECRERAEKRRALSRSLRAAVAPRGAK